MRINLAQKGSIMCKYLLYIIAILLGINMASASTETFTIDGEEWGKSTQSSTELLGVQKDVELIVKNKCINASFLIRIGDVLSKLPKVTSVKIDNCTVDCDNYLAFLCGLPIAKLSVTNCVLDEADLESMLSSINKYTVGIIDLSGTGLKIDQAFVKKLYKFDLIHVKIITDDGMEEECPPKRYKF